MHLLTSEAVPDGDKVSLPECHLHKKLASTDPDKLTQRYFETKHVFWEKWGVLKMNTGSEPQEARALCKNVW